MSTPDFPPTGTALVTGGSGAIGSAVVRRLAELGSRVAFTYRSVVAITTAAVPRAIIRDGLSAGPKGAVQGAIRTLVLEGGRFGVRANSIGVGMTSDGMAAELIEAGVFGERGLADAAANIPLRRFGRAVEVADAAAYLASNRAGSTSGQVLHVDGGYTA